MMDAAAPWRSDPAWQSAQRDFVDDVRNDETADETMRRRHRAVFEMYEIERRHEERVN